MKHLAVIMDGNGRYAVKCGLDRKDGHQLGANAFVQAVHDFVTLPLNFLTVYAFSTENKKRSADEVSNILSVIAYFLKNNIYPFAEEKKIHVRFIGNIAALPQDIRDIVRLAPQFTSDKTIIIALNYGGYDEICRAIKKINETGEKVSEEAIRQSLDTVGIPDPEAVLRYGGYKRLSNFLPLQTAYSELFFTEKSWPEYQKKDFLAVIEQFNKIKRNFGGIGD